MNQPSGANLRNSRGRAKAYTQSGRIAHSGGRLKTGSGSRSRHGSKKRGQKTRSSLNIAGSNPLAMGTVSGGGP